MSATIELPGFANPVGDAQATFRAVLDAMARPGKLDRVGSGLVAPAPLDSATAAVLLALIDNETPLWVDPVAVKPVWTAGLIRWPRVFMLMVSPKNFSRISARQDDERDSGDRSDFGQIE